MKKLILSSVLLLALSPFAHAQTVTLDDAAADDFIARHFPDASIPGPVNGTFKYVAKDGRTLQGYADCFVPAMGERSDGVVSTCTIQY
jgi:hypothetical protein